jgi:hypothetical protein
MCAIIKPPFLNCRGNQYVDLDAAQCMSRQCGDLETLRTGTAATVRRPPAGKLHSGRLKLSGRYAIVGAAGADFISFAAQTFLVEKATNS